MIFQVFLNALPALPSDTTQKDLFSGCTVSVSCSRLYLASAVSHNILTDFPHQMPGSLVIPCVACPKEGFNMEKGWERTPEELK
ncbi:hypothetical protein BDP27DRAFT_1247170 [Rhodocollybia butyracea]|uniref:Uncharacterized protein n=1 Tax=Rhodocollybia butyracea TaxID=206335 RepID=A0A9P5P6S2_9AGAR|nr:hypothetical protein BDP27DRAFT_1247170 [Rhodocollybia butyracea]